MGRRVMRHPEAARDMLREYAAATSDVAASLPWLRDEGWLVRLDEENGTRHYRDLPPGTDYKAAVEERDRELRSDSRYVSAWIFQKKGLTRR